MEAGGPETPVQKEFPPFSLGSQKLECTAYESHRPRLSRTDGLFVKPYPPPAPLPSFTTDQSEGGMASCHPGARQSGSSAPARLVL